MRRIYSPLYSFALSENGWTDWEIALQWLEKNFDPLTREKAAGQTRVLLVDGHSSHLSLPFLLACRERNIVVLCYPPHCTHALQGLDVVCFAKMKTEWRLALDNFYDKTKRGVNKEDFAEIFGHAYNKAFSHDTVIAAFRATGVHPYDPSVITPTQMKPSEVSSIRTTFPLDLPSPARRVIAVFHHQPPTQLDSEPDANPTMTGSSTSTDPSSPGLTVSIADSNVDPALYTPSKRMRLMSASLGQSMSGSYLVSKARIDPDVALHLPVLESPPLDMEQPDFSLVDRCESLDQLSRHELEERTKLLTYNLGLAQAQIQVQQSINESANAQLVVQHLHAEKLQVALQEKEKRKSRDQRTIIFGDGKGRVVTSDEVIDELREKKDKAKEKEEEKETRRMARESKKEAKERLERQWASMKTDHELAVRCWNDACAQLALQGVPRSQWPLKPKRPLKPRLQPMERDHAGSQSEGDDSDNASE